MDLSHGSLKYMLPQIRSAYFTSSIFFFHFCLYLTYCPPSSISPHLLLMLNSLSISFTSHITLVIAFSKSRILVLTTPGFTSTQQCKHHTIFSFLLKMFLLNSNLTNQYLLHLILPLQNRH